ncbi:hypothetical protein PISMIDRAFT_289574 [Pisolithus microcarpus 441]|uniref:Uncharacterized protein n=1 Tax=Pisolithus microcarpus 441 TaxID=765257 RepID=A0A0C9YGI1_9AGAM|nr:hypothetical protein PISMIDRAFT_289574 [Pisolithus microcarpus 441]
MSEVISWRSVTRSRSKGRRHGAKLCAAPRRPFYPPARDIYEETTRSMTIIHYVQVLIPHHGKSARHVLLPCVKLQRVNTVIYNGLKLTRYSRAI